MMMIGVEQTLFGRPPRPIALTTNPLPLQQPNDGLTDGDLPRLVVATMGAVSKARSSVKGRIKQCERQKSVFKDQFVAKMRS